MTNSNIVVCICKSMKHDNRKSCKKCVVFKKYKKKRITTLICMQNTDSIKLDTKSSDGFVTLSEFINIVYKREFEPQIYWLKKKD